MGAYKPRTSPYDFQGLGASCLPWVFETAGKYGIKVIAMEVTHESHIEELSNVDYSFLLEVPGVDEDKARQLVANAQKMMDSGEVEAYLAKKAEEDEALKEAKDKKREESAAANAEAASQLAKEARRECIPIEIMLLGNSIANRPIPGSRRKNTC